MSHNRYHGIDSYAVNFASYKAKVLIRTPLFTENDFEDLQQDLIIAYLHAEPSFVSSKGHKNSFIKTTINNAAKNILEMAETSKRWSGIRNISLFETVGNDLELLDILSDESYAEDSHIRLDLELALKDMPVDLIELLEQLKTNTLKEVSDNTGIHLQTLVSRLKRLRKYLDTYDLRKF